MNHFQSEAKMAKSENPTVKIVAEIVQVQLEAVATKSGIVDVVQPVASALYSGLAVTAEVVRQN
jgi:hypothetical protein